MISAVFRSEPASDSFEDPEFGPITIKRHAKAKHVRLRMADDGKLSVTLPRFANLKHARDLVDSSRSQIRSWQKKHTQHQTIFKDGDQIGSSHTLRFLASETTAVRVKTEGLTITVTHPSSIFPGDSRIQKALKPHLDKALQKEARAYLPRRLRYLADEYGFAYQRIRFGTQKGRWGSCSSRGTISLNVGLMLLEPELIDYVLIHELCHTKQMNHSTAFWSLVESCLPDYKTRRKRIKTNSPTL